MSVFDAYRVLTIVGRCTVERMGPVEIRKAASQGLVRLLVARYGVGKALEHTLRLHSRDAFSGHAAMLELLELASLPGSGREKLCLVRELQHCPLLHALFASIFFPPTWQRD